MLEKNRDNAVWIVCAEHLQASPFWKELAKEVLARVILSNDKGAFWHRLAKEYSDKSGPRLEARGINQHDRSNASDLGIFPMRVLNSGE
jgi:hypothetical protein